MRFIFMHKYKTARNSVRIKFRSVLTHNIVAEAYKGYSSEFDRQKNDMNKKYECQLFLLLYK